MPAASATAATLLAASPLAISESSPSPRSAATAGAA